MSISGRSDASLDDTGDDGDEFVEADDEGLGIGGTEFDSMELWGQSPVEPDPALGDQADSGDAGAAAGAVTDELEAVGKAGGLGATSEIVAVGSAGDPVAPPRPARPAGAVAERVGLPPDTLPARSEPKALLGGVFRTVRFQLTLEYSLLLFGVATIVVGGIYWMLSRSLDEQISREIAAREAAPYAFDLAEEEAERDRAFELAYDARTLKSLQRYSYFGLGALFIMSFGVGWFTAGRALRPIGRITRVAREIQATDLSRRIGLQGPDDDLRQLADTFDAMLDRLQRAFDNQQRLIQDTSHELRNPLAVMRTNLDVTLSDPDADLEAYRHTTEIVVRSSERMSKLVDDLLAYARHEATNRVEAPFDASVALLNLVDEFEGAAAQNGLSLETDVDPQLWIVGHARSFEQAVANLLANAIRFAPDDTAICVTAGAEAGWVWITVSDQGPGIGPEDRERVFQRYARAGEGKAGRPHLAGGEGSGLGLAIVREIVQSHRGQVALLDTPIGATFAIWIPRYVEPEPTGEFRLRRPRRKAGTPA